MKQDKKQQLQAELIELEGKQEKNKIGIIVSIVLCFTGLLAILGLPLLIVHIVQYQANDKRIIEIKKELL